MKAIINRRENVTISLNVCASNTRFSHLHPCNSIYIKLHKFPRKEILCQIQKEESGEIEHLRASIRLCIKVQRTDLCLIVRYSVRTAGESKNQHVITEKEKIYVIQTEKDELLDFARPYLPRLNEHNKKEDADLLRSYFNEYVAPSRLSSIARRITREEEKKAAQMLATYFGF